MRLLHAWGDSSGIFSSQETIGIHHHSSSTTHNDQNDGEDHINRPTPRIDDDTRCDAAERDLGMRRGGPARRCQ